MVRIISLFGYFFPQDESGSGSGNKWLYADTEKQIFSGKPRFSHPIKKMFKPDFREKKTATVVQ